MIKWWSIWLTYQVSNWNNAGLHLFSSLYVTALNEFFAHTCHWEVNLESPTLVQCPTPWDLSILPEQSPKNKNRPALLYSIQDMGRFTGHVLTSFDAPNMIWIIIFLIATSSMCDNHFPGRLSIAMNCPRLTYSRLNSIVRCKWRRSCSLATASITSIHTCARAL